MSPGMQAAGGCYPATFRRIALPAYRASRMRELNSRPSSFLLVSRTKLQAGCTEPTDAYPADASGMIRTFVPRFDENTDSSGAGLTRLPHAGFERTNTNAYRVSSVDGKLLDDKRTGLVV